MIELKNELEQALQEADDTNEARLNKVKKLEVRVQELEMSNDDKQRALDGMTRKYEEARNRGRIIEKKMRGIENHAKDLQV